MAEGNADKAARAKTAGDIMIPLEKYPHVSITTPIRDVIALMEKSQIEVEGRKSLPRVVLVFDELNQLAGLVRRRDIMRALEPSYLTHRPMDYRKKLFDVKVDPNLVEMAYEKITKGLDKRSQRPVSEAMLPIIATVDYEDHIVKVIYEMVDNNTSLLPVLKQGKVVGVVRSVDVLHEVALILL
ncbi:MAG: hypothetical protein Kow0099_31520 [Candidatus Abyssubacteria bacterium]